MAEKIITPEAIDEESGFPENLKHYTSLDNLISILSTMELHLSGSDKKVQCVAESNLQMACLKKN